MKKIILLVTLVLIGASVGLAQKKMYEPKKGSAERKTLMDTIRVYDVARNSDFEGEIFKIHALRVQGNWAFASVDRTNLPEAGEGTHLAFLQKSGAGWKVMWSSYNDNTDEVGVDALKRLRKKHKDFYKELADFAENGFLAG
jgi:hypothetical protein